MIRRPRSWSSMVVSGSRMVVVVVEAQHPLGLGIWLSYMMLTSDTSVFITTFLISFSFFNEVGRPLGMYDRREMILLINGAKEIKNA